MKDSTFMGIAKLIAAESKCVSMSVGAIIVKNDRIIASGYNGTPAGHPNCCDVVAVDEDDFLHNNKKIARDNHHEWSKGNEIHAELNAIIFAAKNGISIDGAVMYCTHSPCQDCAKAITQSGIKKVVYNEKYFRSVDGWDDIFKRSDKTDKTDIEIVEYKEE